MLVGIQVYPAEVRAYTASTRRDAYTGYVGTAQLCTHTKSANAEKQKA